MMKDTGDINMVFSPEAIALVYELVVKNLTITLQDPDIFPQPISKEQAEAVARESARQVTQVLYRQVVVPFMGIDPVLIIELVSSLRLAGQQFERYGAFLRNLYENDDRMYHDEAKLRRATEALDWLRQQNWDTQIGDKNEE